MDPKTTNGLYFPRTTRNGITTTFNVDRDQEKKEFWEAPTTHNKMFLQWCRDELILSFIFVQRYRFVGQDAASRRHHYRNTNVVHNAPGQMSKRTTKILIIGLLTTTGLTFGYFKVDKFLKVDSCLDRGGRWNYETNQCEYTVSADLIQNDTLYKLNGYNELADRDGREVYTISEYNTDLADIENIKRPETQIVNSSVDTSNLFRIWTLDPDGPHADFWIKKEHFYIVDYDGDGRMPYLLNKDSLTIYYNDFVQKGRVLKVTKDSLTIKWDDADEPTGYIEWRN